MVTGKSRIIVRMRCHRQSECAFIRSTRFLRISEANNGQPEPPEPDGLMAHLDAALVQQALYIPEREREPDVEHHRQADDLGARLEVSERAALAHAKTLRRRPAPLKSGCSNVAASRLGRQAANFSQ